MIKTSSAVAAPADRDVPRVRRRRPQATASAPGSPSSTPASTRRSAPTAGSPRSRARPPTTRRPTRTTSTSTRSTTTRPTAYSTSSAGHGTFVSGIVAQVAPGADISVYRALQRGRHRQRDRGRLRADRRGAGRRPDRQPLARHARPSSTSPRSRSPPPSRWSREIEKERRARTCSSSPPPGNFGDTVPTWPAAFRRVVSVGVADRRPAAEHVLEPRLVGRLRDGRRGHPVAPTSHGEQSPDFTDDPDDLRAQLVRPVERHVVRRTAGRRRRRPAHARARPRATRRPTSSSWPAGARCPTSARPSRSCRVCKRAGHPDATRP